MDRHTHSRSVGGEGEQSISHPLVHSPQLQRPGVGQEEARSLQLYLGAQHGQQGPSLTFSLPPQVPLAGSWAELALI